MSLPPVTELDDVAPLEAEGIRAAVRRADPAGYDPARVIATPADAAAVADLLSDPQVSGPMFDLPRPISVETVGAWIEACEAARQRGEAVLMLMREPGGGVFGYSKVTVWPDRAAAELAGALRADHQSAGEGGAGAWKTVGWMFETLGVRLICLTAAQGNIRSARLIEAMGFERLDDRVVTEPDGSERLSHYWEMQRDAWRPGLR